MSEQLPVFMIDPDPTFPLPAPIRRLSGERQVLHLVAKHMSRDAFAQYSKDGAETPETEFVGGLIVSWDEAKHGPYSPERFVQLLKDHAYASRDIYKAYRDTLLGIEEGN